MAPARIRQTRAELLFLAELAGEAERYEDVVVQIKMIIDQYDAQLTIEERNLLSLGYKNITNGLRSSWRVVDTLERIQASRSSGATKQLSLVRRKRDQIERELTDVCKEVVFILDQQLLSVAKQGEEAVFYSKMKGDYYRYLAEFARKRDRERYADLSLNAYKLAYKHAIATLDPVHPTRLGLALNFSVFYHDVRKSPERACHLAKSAFDDAVPSLDLSNPTLNQTLRDSLIILQLLRDDLVLWSGEIEDVN